MDIYTKKDFPYIKETLKKRILSGEIAILPTDTIYGISGNGLDSKVINKILKLKERKNPPSFIPHSIGWIRLLIKKEFKELFDENIEEFTGPYTTLWPYSGKKSGIPLPLCSTGLVGLRFPEHWIRDFTEELNTPLITTSVNIHLKPYMTDLSNLPLSIKKEIGFIVYEGPLYGPPSTIVHCYKEPFEMAERL